MILQNGTYIYSIKTRDTRDQGERAENLFGSWHIVGDTLKLEQTTFKSLDLLFLVKDNKLLPVKQNINNVGSEINLDYLEKKN